MATGPTNVDNSQVYKWETVGSGEAGTAMRLQGGAGLVSSVQAISGGGSGFSTGTLTMQISNDNSTWVTLTDTNGNDVEWSSTNANDIFEIATAAKWIRPSADANISDVDVFIAFA